MKIGIIGTGRIGSTLAQLFAKAGHAVAISNSRDPETLASLAETLGANVQAMHPDEAVQFADCVLLTIPWIKRDTLPPARLFENKITIDATNHYGPRGVVDLGESSSSEEMSKQLPGARLVKAFNTMYYETLRTGGRSAPEERLALFIAGDDSEAKAVVARLIEDIGYAAIDSGFLREGGLIQQPGSPIYNVPMNFSEAQRLLADLK
ncbi:NADPH-dependent F420 reductase [Dictyobacter arantiisoli]|uniref:3-hydroxyisobutyrate dehydrogenase n=1 Tax=Dictyobacter arantiisoli TaxID=2014874 RepID=A0A5A5T988_9CHLR|nr:NAD(P)-binding domain-containing protein [Dictyobacter arantiisoli]GCF07972.1 3-hydroxyisobutyrate dehydrogenase [Dictyobacter arantiisoli]